MRLYLKLFTIPLLYEIDVEEKGGGGNNYSTAFSIIIGSFFLGRAGKTTRPVVFKIAFLQRLANDLL